MQEFNEDTHTDPRQRYTTGKCDTIFGGGTTSCKRLYDSIRSIDIVVLASARP